MRAFALTHASFACICVNQALTHASFALTHATHLHASADIVRMADAASIRKQMLTREFYKRGLLINGIEVDGAVFSANNMLLFKGTFTAGPTVIAEMWIDMNNDLPALDRDARPEHLLWALLFATEYPTVLQLLARLRLGSSNSEKLHKWVWYMAERGRALKAKKVNTNKRSRTCYGTFRITNLSFSIV
jgi:hypothetical protein